MAASISWINIAPVKGFAVVPRDEVELGPNGIDDDRRFHLIGAEGRLLNGKQLAPLVQIVPTGSRTPASSRSASPPARSSRE